MLAKVNGLFRLTRDGELKHGQSGTAFLRLGLACSEKYKDNETTLFLDATAFGKTAEILNQYAGQKGTQIYLSGKLQTEQWTDSSGQKRSKNVMVIEGFDFVSNKGSGQNQQQGQGYAQQGQYAAPQQQGAQTYGQPAQQPQPQYAQPQPQPQQGAAPQYAQPTQQPQQQQNTQPQGQPYQNQQPQAQYAQPAQGGYGQGK